MPTYQKIVWIGLAVTAIAILVLGYFLFLAPRADRKAATLPETTSLATPRPEAASETGEQAEPGIVPLDLELDRSDEAVREVVASAEIPAAMKGWLQQKEIVRTVVAAVDGIARGESPAPHLSFLAPAEKFSVSEKGGTPFLDPRSFRRYDPLVAAFTAVPDRTWATWYKTLRPTLEKAFRELGYPGVTFAQRLQQAVEHLTQVPVIRKDIALEKKVLSYAFADAELENLSGAQKHLLRLGPGNVARVQGKLRSLAALLRLSGKD